MAHINPPNLNTPLAVSEQAGATKRPARAKVAAKTAKPTTGHGAQADDSASATGPQADDSATAGPQAEVPDAQGSVNQQLLGNSYLCKSILFILPEFLQRSEKTRSREHEELLAGLSDVKKVSEKVVASNNTVAEALQAIRETAGQADSGSADSKGESGRKKSYLLLQAAFKENALDNGNLLRAHSA